jgi:hypothetical protein
MVMKLEHIRRDGIDPGGNMGSRTARSFTFKAA